MASDDIRIRELQAIIGSDPTCDENKEIDQITSLLLLQMTQVVPQLIRTYGAVKTHKLTALSSLTAAVNIAHTVGCPHELILEAVSGLLEQFKKAPKEAPKKDADG